MLLLSEGARQVIDAAVQELGDAAQQKTWQNWARAHPRTRRDGDPWDDGGPPLPRDVVGVMLLALDEMAQRMRSRLDEPATEDEISDLDNDLSYIKAIARLLVEGPPIH